MLARPTGKAGSGKGKAGRSAKRSTKPCPICGKPATEASQPFCSDGCRKVDLNRWLSGSYAIPGTPNDDEDAE
ncbi:DNA gyrase inhibitor YacG [Bradyrhizobium canariense]|uniref:DNA gyrase inhibitor YacG n=1 Tax=Bradyrhizobium canariense TaxID=255045 RepID=UPI0011BA6324|nr:DNA gyrase inhibitor YacG [Bradyrhizobium canariense]